MPEAQQKLLAAACDLIWVSSYAQVGINEICQRAGVSKGCFYHYFDSKTALFAAACDFYWQNLRPTLDMIFSPARPARGQLEDFISFLFAKQSADPVVPITGCPFFTAGAQAGADDAEIRRAAEEMIQYALRYMVILLRNLQAEGLFNAQRDPVLWARILYHHVQGLLLHGRVHQDLEMLRVDLQIGMYALLDIDQ